MTVDAEKVAERIAEIAEAEIAPRFGNLEPVEIRAKSSPGDLVTQVDEAVEAALERALAEFWPGAAMIGEEMAAKKPQIVEALRGRGAFWIVDPLDGTRNFVRGVTEFGTIVALVVDGVTRMGWIYAVPERKCAVAELGAGATWDDAPIAPAPQKGPKEQGWRSVGWLADAWRARIAPNLKGPVETKAGHCSAYGYLAVAKGETDFKVSSRIHPWDHAAGALIVHETGGRAAFLDDYSDYAPLPSADRPLLVTAAGRDWTAVAGKLLGAAEGR